MSIDLKIYRFNKDVNIKGNRTDVTKYMTSDININRNINVLPTTMNFEYLITEADIEANDNNNGKAFIKTNDRLPSFINEFDILQVVMVNGEVENVIESFFITNITRDSINNNKSVLDKIYTGNIGGVTLEKYYQGLKFPNKVFTRPSTIDGADNVDSSEFTYSYLWSVIKIIARNNNSLRNSLSINLAPTISSKMGEQATRNFKFSGLSFWQVIVEFFRDMNVVPAVRLNGTTLEIYDKLENSKDVSRPFIDEFNSQGIATYEESVSTDNYLSSITTTYTQSPVGTNDEFIPGWHSEWARDYHNYPAHGGFAPLTTDKFAIATPEDRKSAIFELPFTMNSIDEIRWIGMDNVKNGTNRISVRYTGVLNDWFIKTSEADTKDRRNNKYKYSLGTNFIGGFFDNSSDGGGGDPRTVSDEIWYADDGEFTPDFLKLGIQYVPILDQFAVSHPVNRDSISLKINQNESKQSTSYAKDDKKKLILEGNNNTSLDSITQIIKYEEITDITKLDDILLDLGDTTRENRVVVAQTITLSRGDGILGGSILNKVDLKKDYIQDNLNTEAVSSFDPFAGQQSQIIRNEIVEDYLVVYNSGDSRGSNDTTTYTLAGEEQFLKHLRGYINVNVDSNAERNKDYGTNSQYRRLESFIVKMRSGSRRMAGDTIRQIYHHSAKTFTGAKASGVIIKTKDAANYAPTSIVGWGEDAGSGDNEHTPEYKQSRYGNLVQQVRAFDIDGFPYLLDQSQSFSSFDDDNDGDGVIDIAGLFANYPAGDWHSGGQVTGRSKSINNYTLVQNDGAPPGYINIDKYLVYKDTLERVDFTIQLSTVSSPQLLTGPGMQSNNVLFDSVKHNFEYSTRGYILVYTKDLLPKSVLNLRDIFEELKFSVPGGIGKHTGGSKNVYYPSYDSTVSVSSNSGNSRFQNITIATRDGENTFSVNSKNASFTPTKGKPDDAKYWLLFNQNGVLMVRSLTENNFNTVNVGFSRYDPYTIEL